MRGVYWLCAKMPRLRHSLCSPTACCFVLPLEKALLRHSHYMSSEALANRLLSIPASTAYAGFHLVICLRCIACTQPKAVMLCTTPPRLSCFAACHLSPCVCNCYILRLWAQKWVLNTALHSYYAQTVVANFCTVAGKLPACAAQHPGLFDRHWSSCHCGRCCHWLL